MTLAVSDPYPLDNCSLRKDVSLAITRYIPPLARPLSDNKNRHVTRRMCYRIGRISGVEELFKQACTFLCGSGVGNSLHFLCSVYTQVKSSFN